MAMAMERREYPTNVSFESEYNSNLHLLRYVIPHHQVPAGIAGGLSEQCETRKTNLGSERLSRKYNEIIIAEEFQANGGRNGTRCPSSKRHQEEDANLLARGGLFAKASQRLTS